ncbi:hypothetical protein F5B22DRAFT_222482 [Xylaria bambusicola]|uniref:uncharacterized protein n=1 Tax=Xylaria bambusicola TaxID=326684 RepID=UPI0020077719|nr:uncharacterized protein F5B22DRAFT_222482 [Xylaria bambusicola]KAI0514852.1 hypothetical protein F5B22DRAFT_222482 [Xylaria bambusicola]
MSSRGLIARGVPTLPKLFNYIVITIILLSVIILGLAAHARALSGNYYYESGVPGFLIFASIWTWLVYGAVLAVAQYAPQFYYRIGVLVGQLLSLLFWIAGWTWAASWAAYTLSFDNYRSYEPIRGHWKTFGQTTAACAGIGALIWVLCVAALIIFCTACIRSPSTSNNNVELADVSKQNAPHNQTTTAQPA